MSNTSQYEVLFTGALSGATVTLEWPVSVPAGTVVCVFAYIDTGTSGIGMSSDAGPLTPRDSGGSLMAAGNFIAGYMVTTSTGAPNSRGGVGAITLSSGFSTTQWNVMAVAMRTPDTRLNGWMSAPIGPGDLDTVGSAPDAGTLVVVGAEYGPATSWGGNTYTDTNATYMDGGSAVGGYKVMGAQATAGVVVEVAFGDVVSSSLTDHVIHRTDSATGQALVLFFNEPPPPPASITATMTIPAPHQVHVDVAIANGNGSYDVRYYWGIVNHEALPAFPDETRVVSAHSDSYGHTYDPGDFEDFTSFYSTLEVAVQVRDRLTGDLSNVLYFPIALPRPTIAISPTEGNIPADLTMTVGASAGTPWTGDPTHYSYFWTGAPETVVTDSPVDTYRFMNPVINGVAYCRVDYESGWYVFTYPGPRYTIRDVPNLAGDAPSFRVSFE